MSSRVRSSREAAHQPDAGDPPWKVRCPGFPLRLGLQRMLRAVSRTGGLSGGNVHKGKVILSADVRRKDEPVHSKVEASMKGSAAVTMLAASALGCASRSVAPAIDPSSTEIDVAHITPSEVLPILRCTAIVGRAAAGGAQQVDTLVYDRVPPPYADHAAWYRRHKPVFFRSRYLVQHGQPVKLIPGEVSPVGEFDGIVVYAEFPDAEEQSIVYLPVSPGCRFQPFYYFAGTAEPPPSGAGLGTSRGTEGVMLDASIVRSTGLERP
jgi:hypothetical protein